MPHTSTKEVSGTNKTLLRTLLRLLGSAGWPRPPAAESALGLAGGILFVGQLFFTKHLFEHYSPRIGEQVIRPGLTLRSGASTRPRTATTRYCFAFTWCHARLPGLCGHLEKPGQELGILRTRHDPQRKFIECRGDPPVTRLIIGSGWFKRQPID